ncbi:LeuD/DmdB family oxidoreductase small subunit [Methanoplanus limicola]|uniref:3-isopropylmalate dehydratase, small subunit n=1 Tax=Methanoplanus limicola DSM 2279 TaxID=937775 RepID=H1YY47_9EURY|nr:3-isopropylmalate dehydratase small subunit [Methanoplanus limicola]EHQ36982.1 3-isopropylmalate dehydratase, small subunit [Methanoplanus limicola DSM 2279]
MENKGTAVCIGEDVDTDMIIAGRYLRTKDRKVWADHAFEDYDPDIAGRLKGSVIIAGKNIGCGSSREQAAIALKEAGVLAVVSPSFARIFFRNLVNTGILVFETDEIKCKDGDEVIFSADEDRVEVAGIRYDAKPISESMKEIIRAGGLIEYMRKRR